MRHRDEDTGEEVRVRYAPRLVRLPPLRPRPADLRLVLHPGIADQGHRPADPPAPPGPGRHQDTGAGAAGLEDLRTGPGLRRVPQRGHQPGRRRVPAAAPGGTRHRHRRREVPGRTPEGRGVHRPAQLLRRRPQRDGRGARRGLAVAQHHAPGHGSPLVRPAPAPRQLPHRRTAGGLPRRDLQCGIPLGQVLLQPRHLRVQSLQLGGFRGLIRPGRTGAPVDQGGQAPGVRGGPTLQDVGVVQPLTAQDRVFLPGRGGVVLGSATMRGL